MMCSSAMARACSYCSGVAPSPQNHLARRSISAEVAGWRGGIGGSAWRNAFVWAWFLPCAVLGPVLLVALLRLAAIFFVEVILDLRKASSERRCRREEQRQPSPPTPQRSRVHPRWPAACRADLRGGASAHRGSRRWRALGRGRGRGARLNRHPGCRARATRPKPRSVELPPAPPRWTTRRSRPRLTAAGAEPGRLRAGPARPRVPRGGTV